MILLHLQKFAKIQLEKFEIKFSKFSKISKFQQIKYSRRELNFHDFFFANTLANNVMGRL